MAVESPVVTRRSRTRRRRPKEPSEAPVHRAAGTAPRRARSLSIVTRSAALPATWTGTVETVMALVEPARTITAIAGPALGSDAGRQRPVGRIGGVIGRADPQAL